MKFKDYIFIIFWLIIVYICFRSDYNWFTVIAVCIIYTYNIGGDMNSVFKYNRNKKEIYSEYVSLKIDSLIYEFSTLLLIYLNFKRVYNYRSFYLEYNYNKLVEINNLNDFLNTYAGIDKVMIYIVMIIPTVIIINIIKKIICRGRISSYQILFNDGEIININDIKDIKITDSFFGFSKKITIELENNSKIIYIKNRLFRKIEKDLYVLNDNI